MQKKAYPQQWLGGLCGLNRLASCMVGGQRGILDNSRHDSVGLSPCKGHSWSGRSGSLSITSAQDSFSAPWGFY